MNNGLLARLILSVFEKEGPVPKVCFADLPYDKQLLVAVKTISLLMGEQVYQEGKDIASIKYFGILPFPDLSLTGLTYFFLISDENARGRAKAATISILVDEDIGNFLYENKKQLSIFLAEAGEQLSHGATEEKMKEIMSDLCDRLQNYLKTIKIVPRDSKRKIKVLFTGLDASGKTSFLRAIKQKYSELTSIKPTKGIERSEENLLGHNLIEWDVGGQLIYRKKFLRNAELYLNDTNVLFFLIDVRDSERYEEALSFLEDILNALSDLSQDVPIIINFHKMDPDIINDKNVLSQVEILKERILKIAEGFNVSFYFTSIFNEHSLINTFSEALSQISPNREIFQHQLRWMTDKIGGSAVLLLNERSYIISEFSKNEILEKLSEMVAPHLQDLYFTFINMGNLKQSHAIWEMGNERAILYRFTINNNLLYLLILFEKNEHKTNSEILSEIDHYLPEFKERIKDFIESSF